MKTLLIIVVFTGLLCSGVESSKTSAKDNKNIDQMLEFGFQVFLNCWDNVKEATEKMMKEDMLRTNRIAVQNHWNSFKETANKISAEERDKGVQDDLIIAARIVRRLFMYYKDDVKNLLHSLKENVQLHLPVVNVFKGITKSAQVNEVWSEPIELYCNKLSTSGVDEVFNNVLQAGMNATSLLENVSYESMTEFFRGVSKKAYEIQKIESEKETDDLLLTISVASRVIVFYWDRYLNLTDTPLLQEKYENITRQFEDYHFLLILIEVVTPVMEWEKFKEVWRFYSEFNEEFLHIGLGLYRLLFYYVGPERASRTIRTLGMTTAVHSYPIYKKLGEMGVFSRMKSLYLRSVDVAVALVGDEEIGTLSEVSYEMWKSSTEELNRFVREQRQKSYTIFPQVPAILRFLLTKLMTLVDRVNTEIDDETAKSMLNVFTRNVESSRVNCIKELLDHKVITKEELDQARRIFMDGELELFYNYEDLVQVMDEKRLKDFFRALSKVIIMGNNFIYSQLAQVWDFLIV